MSDTPTPEVDAEDRNYPSSENLQLIQFEGCTVGVISPEDYEELYDKARRLERERDEARAAAAMWKANHDNQVALKSAIIQRPDLKDRAPRVEKLILERDKLRATNAELVEALAFYAGKERADGNGYTFEKEPDGMKGSVARTAMLKATDAT